jgi:hypothetical protein
MTHDKPAPVWQQTNYTGKHELTPKEKAARRRMNIEYIWEYFIDENGNAKN